jgi:hypothetical protein
MRKLDDGCYEDEDKNIRRFKDHKLLFHGYEVKNERRRI